MKIKINGIEYIVENACGEIEIYGRKFAKTYKNSL